MNLDEIPDDDGVEVGLEVFMNVWWGLNLAALLQTYRAHGVIPD